ncbi:LysR family transcriptional regulator [Paraburkholderia silvatlantica]|uniref:LysR family transcriptional regulator n=1 Tax=Paraburkholderia silvatlantica TaxID=321895 RepID=A0A2V4TWB6_9BURK|nr:LysR family transcriptional regulator [Paraburkholderia silvatlantica]PYE18393.1 LysR family transcriptional regulator [Paraburkholderia silvatlantica]
MDFRFAEHLAVFVDVVRAGSFSGAARKRSTTPSSIQRKIDHLESHLGTPLFTRSTRALALTDAGEHLFQRAQRILGDLIDTRAEITSLGGTMSGTLRLASLPTFGRRYLIPVIQHLMDRHRELRVELDLTERLADPVVDRLDAVVRIGTLNDSSLIATRLATQKRILVASPGYLAHSGQPHSMQELVSAHRRLDKLHGADLLGWRDLAGYPAEDFPVEGTVFHCDDFEALRAACLAGLGIGFLPTWVVGQDVRAGALRRLLPQHEPAPDQESGIYLLRAQPQPSVKMKTFIAALRQSIGALPIWEDLPETRETEPLADIPAESETGHTA